LIVADNFFVLQASNLLSSVPGIFFYGANQIQVPFGNGNRCVGGALFRLPVVITGINGEVAHLTDLPNPPIAAGLINPGSTWNFQFWVREVPAGGAGFNLTNVLAVAFCP
jgi:hypothetical protein